MSCFGNRSFYCRNLFHISESDGASVTEEVNYFLLIFFFILENPLTHMHTHTKKSAAVVSLMTVTVSCCSTCYRKVEDKKNVFFWNTFM